MSASAKRRLAPLCGAILLAFVGGCSQSQQYVRNPFTYHTRDREMRYSLAQVMEREGDLFKAEHAYRDLAKERPRDSRFQHRHGVVLVRQGQVEEGIAALEKARELKPDDSAVLNDLGYAYLLQGEFASAEETLRRALAINAKDSRAANNLALAVGYAGRSNEAYELFRRNQDEASARASLAYVLSQRGDLSAAAQEYNRSLSKNPENRNAAEALVQLAELQREVSVPNVGDGDIKLVTAQDESIPASPAARNAADTLDNADEAPVGKAAVRLEEIEPVTSGESTNRAKLWGDLLLE